MINAVLQNFVMSEDTSRMFAPIFVEVNRKYYPIIKRAAHLQGQNKKKRGGGDTENIFHYIQIKTFLIKCWMRMLLRSFVSVLQKR